MNGYKGFDKNLQCKNMQYEVGKEYIYSGKISICNTGYHFCQKLIDVHEFYKLNDSRICEIEAFGEIFTEGTKSVTDKIRIIRELSRDEVLSIVNTGIRNTGFINSGNRNSGDRNSGNYNSGNYNSGNYNSGNRNSGDCNSGNYNSGDYNSGDRNSGNYNSCNNSSGVFMSKRISYEAFNKSLSESENKELLNSKGYKVCSKFSLIKYRVRTKTEKYGDYKYMSYKKSWAVLWNSLSFEERNAVRNMPHIDKAVFEEITGIKL